MVRRRLRLITALAARAIVDQSEEFGPRKRHTDRTANQTDRPVQSRPDDFAALVADGRFAGEFCQPLDRSRSRNDLACCGTTSLGRRLLCRL
jgi:hypothetical protein